MAKQVTKTVGKSEVAADTKTKTSREETVRKLIKESLADIDHKYIDLASWFSEAYHKDYARKWGFEEGIAGWKEYCAKELDIHYRKAMYFIDIFDSIKKLDLAPKDIEKIGWSKMKEIVTVMTTKNAKEWLEKAKKLSVRELTEAVKMVRRKAGKGREDVPHIVTMSWKLSDQEASIVTDALEEGKGLLDTENAVSALVMICQDWMEAKGVTPTRATLDDHVKFLEKQFGVAISFKKVKTTKQVDAEAEAEETAKAAAGKKTTKGGKAEKEKIVEKAKKKAKKEAKKSVAASDDMDDILGGDGAATTDEDLDKELGLDD